MKRKIAVLGGGISGYGSAILAKKKGFDVFLSDMGKIADRFKARLDEWEVEYEEGKHTEERILDANEVIKSLRKVCPAQRRNTSWNTSSASALCRSVASASR